LTYSGQFAHMNGHPLATGRAQDKQTTMARQIDYVALEYLDK